MQFAQDFMDVAKRMYRIHHEVYISRDGDLTVFTHLWRLRKSSPETPMKIKTIVVRDDADLDRLKMYIDSEESLLPE